MDRSVLAKHRRTALSVSRCVRIFRKIVSGVCLLSGFSVRILSVRILWAVRILSGLFEKCCPLSACPAGQGRDRAVRTCIVLVRRRLVLALIDKVYCQIDFVWNYWLILENLSKQFRQKNPTKQKLVHFFKILIFRLWARRIFLKLPISNKTEIVIIKFTWMIFPKLD